jgi:hypothetical protein
MDEPHVAVGCRLLPRADAESVSAVDDGHSSEAGGCLTGASSLPLLRTKEVLPMRCVDDALVPLILLRKGCCHS